MTNHKESLTEFESVLEKKRSALRHSKEETAAQLNISVGHGTSHPHTLSGTPREMKFVVTRHIINNADQHPPVPTSVNIDYEPTMLAHNARQNRQQISSCSMLLGSAILLVGFFAMLYLLLLLHP